MENNSQGFDKLISPQNIPEKTYDTTKLPERENEANTQNKKHKKTFVENENEQEKYINKIKNNNDDIEIIISTINENKRDYSYNSRYNNYKRFDYYENNQTNNEQINNKGNHNINHYNNNYYGNSNSNNQNNYTANNYQNSISNNANSNYRNSNTNNYYKQTHAKNKNKIPKENTNYQNQNSINLNNIPINSNLNTNTTNNTKTNNMNLDYNNNNNNNQNPNFFNCNLISQVNNLNFNKRQQQIFSKIKSKKMSKQNHFIYTYEKTNDFNNYNTFFNLNLKFLKQNYKFRDSLEFENPENAINNNNKNEKNKKGKKKNSNNINTNSSNNLNNLLNINSQQQEYLKFCNNYNQMLLMNQMQLAQNLNKNNKENINFNNNNIENEQNLKISSADEMVNINFINPYFLNNLSQAQANYNYNVLMQNSKILNQNENEKIKNKDKNRINNNNINNNLNLRNVNANVNSQIIIPPQNFNYNVNNNNNEINHNNNINNNSDNDYLSDEENNLLKNNLNNNNNNNLNSNNISNSNNINLNMHLQNQMNLSTNNFFDNSNNINLNNLNNLNLQQNLNNLNNLNLQQQNLQNFQVSKDPKVIEENLLTGRYLTGLIRINRCHTHGYITVAGLYNDILIRGNRNLNQSLHCDEVVVELFPMVLWKPLFNKKSRKMSMNNIKEENKNFMLIQHGKNLENKELENENNENENYEKNLQVKELVKKITGGNNNKEKEKEKGGKRIPKKIKSFKNEENLNCDKLENNEGNFGGKVNTKENNNNNNKDFTEEKEPEKKNATNNSYADYNSDEENSDSQYEEDEESEESETEKEENATNLKEKTNLINNYDSLAYFNNNNNNENSEMNFKENFKTLEERLIYINQLCNLRPEGRIVKIIRSPNMEKNQIVKIVNENSLIFGSPIDENIPKIFIKMKKFRRMEFLRKLENDIIFRNKYFLVKIVGWALNFKCPKGIIINELGNSGDIDVESEVLLRAYEVEHSEEYPKNALDEIKKFEDWQIPESTIKERHDLRDKTIFTIDPKTSKDLDDAISCELINPETGLLEIGVHIADPTYFIPKDSFIDKEALNRTTTVYMVHKNIPMLPRNLSDNIISLLPQKDRVALSCTFRIFFDGSLDQNFVPKFYLSVINSSAKLNYELAQRILDNENIQFEDLSEKDGTRPIDKFTFEIIVDSLKNLRKLTTLVRSQRIESGSLIIENQEINFDLNEEKKPINFSLKRKLQTHQLVEELMLIANKFSAEYLCENIENLALVRKHPLLNESKYQDMQRYFKNNKINVDFEDTLELNKMLKNLEKVDKNKYIRAEYAITKDKEISELRHCALNFDLYTHFTSPIRRYPDLVVHRQLKYILNKKKLLIKNSENSENSENSKNSENSENSENSKISCGKIISETESDRENTNLINNSNLFYNFIMENVLKKLEKMPQINSEEVRKKSEKNEYEFEHIINYEKHIDHFNERYYNGKQISQKCQKLFQYIFLKNIPDQIYKALIIDISNKIPLKNKRNTQINFETQSLIISLYIPCLNIELDWTKDDNTNIINFKFKSETSVSIDYKDELDKNVHNKILRNFDEVNVKITPIDTVPIDIKSNLIFT